MKPPIWSGGDLRFDDDVQQGCHRLGMRLEQRGQRAAGLFSAFLIHLLHGGSLLSWLQARESSYQMLSERATGPISTFNYGWDTLLDRGDEVSLLLHQSLIP